MLDNKSISDIEPVTNLGPSNYTISLNSSQKWRRDDSRTSNKAILMSETLEKITIVLTQWLSRREITSNNVAFKKKISDIEYLIEAKIETF